MAKTLLQLRTLTRALLSEPVAKYWNDAEINGWINDGAGIFCDLTDCLDDISTDSGVQYQPDYDCPSDYTKIQKIEYVRGNSVYDATPATLYEQYTGLTRNSMSQPYRANIVGNKIRFDVRLNAAANADTLNGALTASVTTITLDDVTGFPREGRVKIDDEIIEYCNVDTDNEELEVCTRGAEGTTAATHADGATVTLRDIWIYHFKRPATLSSDTSTTELPIQFENAPAHYAAYIGRMKSKDYDLADSQKATFDDFVAKGLVWAKQKIKRSYRPR